VFPDTVDCEESGRDFQASNQRHQKTGLQR
jgi:hypothetical protein